MSLRRTRIYVDGCGLYVFWIPESSQLGVADFNGVAWAKEMRQQDRVDLLGGNIAIALLEEKWNDVFDEAGFAIERGDDDDIVSLRFGTKQRVQLEKTSSPMNLLSKVLHVLLASYEGARKARRSTGAVTGKTPLKKHANAKKIPPSRMTNKKEVSVLNRNLKKRAGPSKGPVFADDDDGST